MGIKVESLRVLKEIPKENYQACFRAWKQRMHKCIFASGDYFEGNHTDIDKN